MIDGEKSALRLIERPHPLALAVHAQLVDSGLTLALAESCTGGLIADLITDISGSSAYFLGSAVTYANSAKQGIVGVREETLALRGAVSAETAAEMAQGARRAYGADIAASVTGIAGPTGATPGKPVGLVCIHLALRRGGAAAGVAVFGRPVAIRRPGATLGGRRSRQGKVHFRGVAPARGQWR